MEEAKFSSLPRCWADPHWGYQMGLLLRLPFTGRVNGSLATSLLLQAVTASPVRFPIRLLKGRGEDPRQWASITFRKIPAGY